MGVNKPTLVALLYVITCVIDNDIKEHISYKVVY